MASCLKRSHVNFYLTIVNYDGSELYSGRISTASWLVELALPVTPDCIRVALFVRPDVATGLCCSVRWALQLVFPYKRTMSMFYQFDFRR